MGAADQQTKFDASTATTDVANVVAPRLMEEFARLLPEKTATPSAAAPPTALARSPAPPPSPTAKSSPETTLHDTPPVMAPEPTPAAAAALKSNSGAKSTGPTSTARRRLVMRAIVAVASGAALVWLGNYYGPALFQGGDPEEPATPANKSAPAPAVVSAPPPAAPPAPDATAPQPQPPVPSASSPIVPGVVRRPPPYKPPAIAAEWTANDIDQMGYGDLTAATEKLGELAQSSAATARPLYLWALFRLAHGFDDTSARELLRRNTLRSVEQLRDQPLSQAATLGMSILKGKHLEVRRRAERLLRQDAATPQLLLIAGLAWQRERPAKRAQAVWQRLIQQAPTLHEAALQRALAWLAEGKIVAAENALHALAHKAGIDVALRAALALERAQRFQALAAVMDVLATGGVETDLTAVAPARQSDFLRLLVRQALRSGKFAQATTLAGQRAALTPKTLAAEMEFNRLSAPGQQVELSWAQATADTRRQNTAAISRLARQLRRGAPAARLYLQLARLLVENGLFAQAAAHLEGILWLDPTLVDPVNLLVMMVEASRRRGAANGIELTEQFAVAKLAQPLYDTLAEDDRTAEKLATATERSGSWRDAARVYERLLARHPRDVRYTLKLAALLHKTGQGDDARRWLDGINPDKNPSRAPQLADAATRANIFLALCRTWIDTDVSQARRYREAASSHQIGAESMLLLGLIEEKEGKIATAATLYQRALNEDTQLLEARWRLARAEVLQGLAGEAAAGLRPWLRRTTLEPASAPLVYWWGKAAEQLGRAQEAQEAWQMYLRLAPDGEFAAASREALSGRAGGRPGR